MTVTTTDVGSARVVSWDRQERRNAWDLETMTAIAEAVEDAGSDERVRCVVLRGAGEHFSAGDDLQSAIEADAAAWAATIEGFQRMTRVVLASSLPAIAAVDGVCVGGALEFAASCDLRIATDRARFATPEVGIGLVATNAGTLLLPEVLGETAARELLLTGTLRDAQWALRNRFVAELVAPEALDERIAAWAAQFDRTSRTAVATTKRMLNARLGDLVAAAMEREERACNELFAGPDAPAALRAFADRAR
jgi:enoyl-CoA hydratase/carnithine racemase